MKKIMICDDEADLVEMFEMILEPLGASISSEQNSTRLFGRLQADKPDLLILDISMPGLSGDEILKHIREDGYLKDLPVYMVSADLNGKARAAAAGATLFFEKPFDIELFLSKVQQQLAD